MNLSTTYEKMIAPWQTFSHLLTCALFESFPRIDVPTSGVSRYGFWVDLFDYDHLDALQLRTLEKHLQSLAARSSEIKAVSTSSKGVAEYYKAKNRFLKRKQAAALAVCDAFCFGDFLEESQGFDPKISHLSEISLYATQSITRKEGGRLFGGVRIFGLAFDSKERLLAFQKKAIANLPKSLSLSPLNSKELLTFHLEWTRILSALLAKGLAPSLEKESFLPHFVYPDLPKVCGEPLFGDEGVTFTLSGLGEGDLLEIFKPQFTNIFFESGSLFVQDKFGLLHHLARPESGGGWRIFLARELALVLEIANPVKF